MLCHVERLLLWFNLGGLLQYYATRTFQINDPLLQERSNRSVPSLRALSEHTISCHLWGKSSLDVVQASIKPSRYRDFIIWGNLFMDKHTSQSNRTVKPQERGMGGSIKDPLITIGKDTVFVPLLASRLMLWSQGQSREKEKTA